MRFTFAAEEEAFRADVCAFLRRELTPEVWRAHRDANEQGFWTADFTSIGQINALFAPSPRPHAPAAGPNTLGHPAAVAHSAASRRLAMPIRIAAGEVATVPSHEGLGTVGCGKLRGGLHTGFQATQAIRRLWLCTESNAPTDHADVPESSLFPPPAATRDASRRR